MSWRVNYGSEGISYAIFCTSPRWSALTVWPQGVLVRHGKLLYRALGIHNVAIPGDSHHGRFFVSIIADFSGIWYSISADRSCVLRFMLMIFAILAVTFETVKFCFNFFYLHWPLLF